MFKSASKTGSILTGSYAHASVIMTNNQLYLIKGRLVTKKENINQNISKCYERQRSGSGSGKREQRRPSIKITDSPAEVESSR